MAAKRAGVVRAAAASSDPDADATFIQEAYGEALKNLVKVLVENYIANVIEPEKKFAKGLAFVRKAREEALRLVKE